MKADASSVPESVAVAPEECPCEQAPAKIAAPDIATAAIAILRVPGSILCRLREGINMPVRPS